MSESRERIRIVVLGAVDFSAHCLTTLIRAGASVVGVLGLATELAGRHADYANLEPIARVAGISYRFIRSINDDSALDFLRSVRPDVLMVLGWSEIVKRSVLGIPKMGTIGSHPTLLPAHRGHHPIIWSLVRGLEQGGVTLFWMSERVDQGSILAQRAFSVALEDDAASVYEKVKATAAELLMESLLLLERGDPPRILQDETLATYWPKRTAEDGEIQWSARTRDIYNLVRALTRPYPGATTQYKNEVWVVWKVKEVSPASETARKAAVPGTVLAVTDGKLRVCTGDGAIDLLQWSGMAQRPRVGERLG